jgi:pimeloyl-ACP methyl ester carboxylesterase
MQEAYRHGVDGWVDDDLALASSWGFDLPLLAVPTMVWFGIDDTLVPAAHGEWLATHVNNAQVVRMTGGHMEMANRVEDLVTWLIGGDLPEDATAS